MPTSFQSPVLSTYLPTRYMVMCIAIIFVYTTVISTLILPVHGSLISSSALQMCTRTSDEPEGCKRKLVVTLTIDGEQKPGTEELLFLTSTTDETDANNTVMLKTPLYLTTSRSVVVYRYPLYYVRDFNGKPYEEYVTGKFFNRCNADYEPGSSMCGVATDRDGNYIRYSEGFCCGCNSCAAAGICATNGRMRGLCSVVNTYTAAWCLRFNKDWYRGYNIGRYLISFNIDLLIKTNSTPSGENVETELHLSPSQLGASSPTMGITTRLIGDLSPYEQPLDLSQSMLFVPLPDPKESSVVRSIANWIILPQSKVTVDGRECNKVGVSYEAHYFQANKCNGEVNSCLNNQLDDYLKYDKEAVINGKRGQYTARQIADFEQMDDGFDDNYSVTGMHYIGYKLKSPPPSMITITIDADELVFVTPVSTGRIVSAGLIHPTITASTRDGVMQVWVENTGTLTARFTLSVINCSSYVFPVLAQVLSLSPQENKLSTFEITVQELNYSGTAQCTVALYNAVEELIDTRNVTWKVEAMNPTNGSQGGESNVVGATGVPGKNQKTCDTCGWFNIRCAFGQACPKKISLQLSLIIGIVILLLILCIFRSQICGCCGLGLCCGSGRRRGNNKAGHETVQVCVTEPTYQSHSTSEHTAVEEQKKMRQQMMLQLLSQQQQQQQQFLLLQSYQQQQRAPNLITWNATNNNNNNNNNNMNEREAVYYASSNCNQNRAPYER